MKNWDFGLVGNACRRAEIDTRQSPRLDAVRVSVFGIGPQMLQKGILSSPRPVTWLDSVYFKYWDPIPTRTRDLKTKLSRGHNFLLGRFPLVTKLKLSWGGRTRRSTAEVAGHSREFWSRGLVKQMEKKKEKEKASMLLSEFWVLQ